MQQVSLEKPVAEHARQSEKQQPDGDPRRCRIRCNNRQLYDITGQVLRAMKQHNEESVRSAESPDIYVLGDALTEVRFDSRTGHPVLKSFSVPSMRGRVSDIADFVTVSKDGRVTNVFPPDKMVENILNANRNWDFPIIQGVTRAPIVGRDGSISTKPGYDPTTGFYFHPGDFIIPPVSQQPTKQEIAEALALFGELLWDFPFITQADKAHMLAACLDPALNQVIEGNKPFYLFGAPTPGTGKGLQADVCALVGSGALARLTTANVRAEEEMRKKLTSLLIEGHQVVQFDNVKRYLDSESLAAVATRREWTDRVLGFSRSITVPNNTTFFFTANNLGCSDEMSRRLVPSRIDARIDQPDQRTGFWHDPLIEDWMRPNLGRLLWAKYTLIRAWFAAQCPRWKTRKLGSFEIWAEVLGGILEVVGVPGFLDNLEESRKRADRASDEVRAFVKLWWEAIENEPKDPERRTTKPKLSPELCQLTADHEVLADVRGEKEDSQRIRFGRWLEARRDRTYAVDFGTEDGPRQCPCCGQQRGNHQHQFQIRIADRRDNKGRALYFLERTD